MTASVLDRHFTDHDTSNASKPVTEASVLPLQCYTDEQFYRDEIETVMMRSWLPVGREDQVANTGDYFTVDLFGESVVIVRGSDNEIRALSNVCRHRATQVVDNGSGNKPAFVCPYHTWSYNLDGTLRAAPHMDEAAGFDRANCRLPAFPLERWNGFLFLNFDADAQPLGPQIAPLTAELEPYRLAERKSKIVNSLDCDWNWKVSLENFTEAYHHIGIHLNSVEPYAPANKTVYEDTNNAYSLFWMFAADDDHYLSSLFPEIPELQGKYRNSGVANVYPFLHLLLAQDVILWLNFELDSVQRHRLVWRVLVPEQARALDDFEARLEKWMEEINTIISEDIYACTMAASGQRSRFYRPGRMSHMEKSVHQMHGWLLSRMAGEPLI